MRITVTKVGEPVGKTSAKGKPYKMFEVQFVADGRAGKRQLMSFNEKAFKPILAAQEGAEFDIETQQDGEYLNWTKATPVAASEAAPAAAGNGTAKAAAATPFKSTYETAEERAKRQVYIVRQSSIANAIAFLKSAETNPSKEDVVDTAMFFEAYVFGAGVVTNELDDDIPF